MDYTIKDLKKLIKRLPDNTLIGTSSHFGEFEPAIDISIKTVNVYPQDKSWLSGEGVPTKILNISMPDLGPDPD